MTKKAAVIWCAVMLCLLAAVNGFRYVRGDFGVKEWGIEADARQEQRVPQGWAEVHQVREDIAAYLFYPEGAERQRDTPIFSVYQKEGWGKGWHYRLGGSGPQRGVQCWTQGDSRIFLSLNEEGAALAVWEGEDRTWRQELDPEGPFALVTPKQGTVTLFDREGRMVGGSPFAG